MVVVLQLVETAAKPETTVRDCVSTLVRAKLNILDNTSGRFMAELMATKLNIFKYMLSCSHNAILRKGNFHICFGL